LKLRGCQPQNGMTTYHLKCLKLILVSMLIACVGWWAPSDRLTRKKVDDVLGGDLTVLFEAHIIGGAISVVQDAQYRGVTFFPLESARPDLLQSPPRVLEISGTRGNSCRCS
jgi:hypothetical protein